MVSTFTSCTIPGVLEAIRGIARVLKPDGRLIFFELGLAPDPRVQRWQVWLEGVYHWVFQGLYLTRDIPALLQQGGFRIEHMEAGATRYSCEPPCMPGILSIFISISRGAAGRSRR